MREYTSGTLVRQMFYDAAGDLTRVLDGRGNETRLEYYDRGLVRRVVHPGGAAKQFEYDPAGNLTRSLNELGQPTTMTYDLLDRPTSTTFAGETFSTVYDARGNAVETIAPESHAPGRFVGQTSRR